jgi:uridine kinase/CYTH domain-containing protein
MSEKQRPAEIAGGVERLTSKRKFPVVEKSGDHHFLGRPQGEPLAIDALTYSIIADLTKEEVPRDEMDTETGEVKEVPKEIEKKYTVQTLPDLEGITPKTISQSYLLIAPSGKEVRIRQKNTACYITEKGGSGMSRSEREAPISAEVYTALLSYANEGTVTKQRYEIPLPGDVTAELDIYSGTLEGLYTVEVEFPDEQAAEGFTSPDWFGNDVTKDKNYKNQSLAQKGNPEKLPTHSSQETYSELAEGVDAAEERIRQLMSEKLESVIVFVAGGSGSGKTEAVSKELARRFPDEVITLSLDDYYKGAAFMKEQAAHGNVLSWDQPEAVDLALAHEHIATLRTGGTAQVPTYDFKTGTRTGTRELASRKVVIVEGLFALNKEMTDSGDLKIFVDTDPHGRLMRRIGRDEIHRGVSMSDTIAYFAQKVEPEHQAHVETTKPNADLVIKNDYNPTREQIGEEQRQLKLRLTIDPASLVEKLQNSSALLTYTGKQYDDYYVPNPQSSELLRIRTEGRERTLTYKGELGTKPTPYQVRSTLTRPITDGTYTELKRLYGEPAFSISKNRTSYLLADGTALHIDENVTRLSSTNEDEENFNDVISFGNHVEILPGTNKTNQAIDQLLDTLGLGEQVLEKLPYSQM